MRVYFIPLSVDIKGNSQLLRFELDEEVSVGVEDLVGLIKAEGIFLMQSKEGSLLVVPPDGIRDEILELISEYTGPLLEWLGKNAFHDA